MGIAVLMYPVFKPIGKEITNGYLISKLLEGLLMIVAGIFFIISSTQSLRGWVYDGIHVYVFIVSGFLFYYLLLKSEIVPGFISIWGALGLLVLLVSTLLKLFDIPLQVFNYFLILIITNEVFLAIWLMIKGMKNIPKPINT
jgi:hypothetical protein